MGKNQIVPDVALILQLKKQKKLNQLKYSLYQLSQVKQHRSQHFLTENLKETTRCVDSDEDNFVLRSLYTFKLINWIIAWVVSILLVLGALICLGSHAYSVGFGMLGSILVVVYVYFLENLILSWFRGIYRNLMWLKVISQTMPAPKLTSEKK